MGVGANSVIVDAFLASLLNGTSFTAYGALYVQLHTGAPGAAGTSNVAGESTREPAGTFTSPAGGQATNNASVTWTAVSTAETYSDVSLWSAATGGVFVTSGTITANTVGVGDNFTIPIGDMLVEMPVAS